MIKLIATDMDGTLLNSSNEIQEGFYEVFNELQEKEIIFAAVIDCFIFNKSSLENFIITPQYGYQ